MIKKGVVVLFLIMFFSYSALIGAGVCGDGVIDDSAINPTKTEIYDSLPAGASLDGSIYSDYGPIFGETKPEPFGCVWDIKSEQCDPGTGKFGGTGCLPSEARSYTGKTYTWTKETITPFEAGKGVKLKCEADILSPLYPKISHEACLRNFCTSHGGWNPICGEPLPEGAEGCDKYDAYCQTHFNLIGGSWTWNEHGFDSPDANIDFDGDTWTDYIECQEGNDPVVSDSSHHPSTSAIWFCPTGARYYGGDMSDSIIYDPKEEDMSSYGCEGAWKEGYEIYSPSCTCSQGYVPCGEDCGNGCCVESDLVTILLDGEYRTICLSGPSVTEISLAEGKDDSVKDVECKVYTTFKKSGTYSIKYELVYPNETVAKTIYSSVDVYLSDTESYKAISETEFFSDFYNIKTGLVKCRTEIRESLASSQVVVSESELLGDIDQDGYMTVYQLESNGTNRGDMFDRIDCDDWPFDDINIEEDYYCLDYDEVKSLNIKSKTKAEKEEYCYGDENNNGIGENASCSYCRNPGMSERCDDIDNDCYGRCQGHTGNTCFVEDYEGDGAVDDNDTFIPYYDMDKGLIIEDPVYMNCVGVKNEYGQKDEFCQMVDDSVSINGEYCGGYDRCVRSVEYKETPKFKLKERHYCPGEEDDVGGVIVCEAGYRDLYEVETVNYSFSPGAVRGEDAKCGKIVIKEKVSCPETEIPDIKLESPYGCNHADVISIVLEKNCTAEKENIGKTRGTEKIGDQLIDSFRGELNFTEFWDIMKEDKYLTGDPKKLDNTKFFWGSSCVYKDKCADGADNDGNENLFSADPYKLYLPTAIKELAIEERLGEKAEEYTAGELYLPLKLTDVDDPDCNFVEGVSADSSKKYPEDKHLKSSITNTPYCLDEDEDGFCGCVEKTETECLIYAEKCVKESDDLGEDGDSGDCEEWEEDLEDCLMYKTTCNKGETLKNYSISKYFIDCDDSKGDDGYQYLTTAESSGSHASERIKTYHAIGWGENMAVDSSGAYKDPFVNQDFSAFHVHPMAPVTRTSCFFGRYDFNCNKDSEEGFLDKLVGLSQGTAETPFDFDSSTGIEKMTDDLVFKQKNKDLICYTEPPYREFASTTGIMIGMTVVSFGATAGLGSSALLVRVASRGLLTGMNVIGVIGDAYDFTILSSQIGEIAGELDAGESWNNVMRKHWLPVTTSVLSLAPYTKMAVAGREGKIANFLNSKVKLRKSLKFIQLEPPAPSRFAAMRAEQLAHPEIVKPGVAGGCFLENTSIVLANGSTKDIEDIKVGDEVLAFDLDKNVSVNTSVTAFFIRNETRYRVIEYEII